MKDKQRKYDFSGRSFSYYDENDHEVLNPEPLFEQVTPKPLSIGERVKRAVDNELSKKAVEHGMESVEEANDFNVEDGFEEGDPITNHEIIGMDEEYLVEKPVPESHENDRGEPEEVKTEEAEKEASE